ncbi:AraC family transcriptional regulator [Paramixta manurensis]|uniref:AraC family transcriptional regulator n=1 Tax=Paramixta manurensis TaxID=2740817 RepID=A0A6M8ULG8_9GAMM|nr:AraC family transcriptional regulator [Erwiniaceae bacterium PD-1]
MAHKKTRTPVEPESALMVPSDTESDFWVTEKQHPGGTHIIPHQHAHFAQLIFVISGCATFYFRDRVIIASQDQAVFIPCNQEHSIDITRHTALRTLSIFSPDDYHDHGDQPYRFQVGALLKALSDAVCLMTRGKPSNEKEQRLYHVLIDQLNQPHHPEIALPLPADPRVKKAIYLLANPDYLSCRMRQLCQQIGVGERTLTRLFIVSTGMTFTEYKRKIQIEQAISLLKEGHSVVDVALKVGYETQSGFIYAFKNHTGVSPLKFKKSDRHHAN